MYQYIKGVLKEVTPQYITLESGGIGYLIHAPNPFRFESALESEVVMFTDLIVREDSHTLYGFKDMEEKTLFQSLLKVTGIGPKSAMAILAASTPAGVINAIENEDQAYMQKFPGVGKKTASQIILDLKGKLTQGEAPMAEEQNGTNAHYISEALLALEALGYSKREITRIEKHLKTIDINSVDEAVKSGLKFLVQ
ncbi:MAG TPA: Holliday junction branch migration protein RuvA [Candidatus Salinicoccus stercoripullorum]|uniref:Holliday junction branch migration complex subunit RuvA n=1 Tax=Candidatus Salinicoccus stercoripullorum TaxID=2838756 RepID=A0A9D1U0S8_9STAP|nr:Holliday junction branch migration protein RuvA [Candidatus Salinicoccus stercoripullorum]